MSEDCYWYVDDRVQKKKQKMQALCTECHKTHDFGWFWQGSELGYGDYDLACSICNKVLNDKNAE